MTWYKFWSKRNEESNKKVSKDSVDTQLLNMDFFSQLSYMAAIATSGVSRSGLFYHASKLPYISAQYFKKVDFIAKAFNHDYASACRIAGQKTKEPEAKGLLLRLSGALASGEDTTTFLERESEVFSESYGNWYERQLDVLKNWTDAYIALIMSSALVTIMAVVAMMIGTATMPFILAIGTLTVLVTIGGSWIIYRTVPKEIKVHSLPCRSREQNLARSVAKLTLFMGGITILVLMVMKVDLGWIILSAGIFLFPLGLISMIDDRKIDKRDSEISGFLRSLGAVSQAISATISEAMGRLNFRSLGTLREDVSLLYARLLVGINPDLCWGQFVGETGSEQVNRSVRIFWDGVTLGGEPERVGNDASSFAMKIALLRAKRRLITSGFTWLAIVMHTVLTALMVFIYQMLVTFSTFMDVIFEETDAGASTAGIMSDVSSVGGFGSGSVELSMLYIMVIAIIIILTFANAIAVYATSGAHIFKLAFYLAITATISGICLITVPSATGLLFA